MLTCPLLVTHHPLSTSISHKSHHPYGLITMASSGTRTRIRPGTSTIGNNGSQSPCNVKRSSFYRATHFFQSWFRCPRDRQCEYTTVCSNWVIRFLSELFLILIGVPWECTVILSELVTLLPTAYVVRGKVMF